MFTELTEELLDLEATTKGYGGARSTPLSTPAEAAVAAVATSSSAAAAPRSAGEHDGTARGAPAGRTSRPPAAARALVARRRGP